MYYCQLLFDHIWITNLHKLVGNAEPDYSISKCVNLAAMADVQVFMF